MDREFILQLEMLGRMKSINNYFHCLYLLYFRIHSQHVACLTCCTLQDCPIQTGLYRQPVCVCAYIWIYYLCSLYMLLLRPEYCDFRPLLLSVSMYIMCQE